MSAYWYATGDGGFSGRSTHSDLPIPYSGDMPCAVTGPVRTYLLPPRGRRFVAAPAWIAPRKRRGAPAGIVLPLVERTEALK